MIVESSLQYCGRGWALVPYRTGKILGFKGCTILEAATRDPRTIEKWTWAESVGLACGAPSGIDVLDVDDVSACPLAVATLLSSTLAARTPRGAYHLFFKFAGLRTRAFS
jgi:hypothetical protein